MSPDEFYEQRSRHDQPRQRHQKNPESWFFGLFLILVLESCIILVMLSIWMLGEGYL